jgi:hypothetical protein
MALVPREQIQIYRDATLNVLGMRMQEAEVCQYFGVIFSDKGINTLTKQDMTGFLSYRQNHRWREISREDVTADMERLRAALRILTDAQRPIAERLNLLEPGRGEGAVKHLGKAKLTALLLVTAPKEFGVWNDYSERALVNMGLMPEFEAGMGLGDQYNLFNMALTELSEHYRVSLWWLDIILERIARLVR